MNRVATVRLTRPPGIGAEEPVPIPINNTLEMHAEARYGDGQPVNFTNAKIYLTIKSVLANSDELAELQIDSASDSTCFDISATVHYAITIPAGDLVSALSVDTNYYIDTQIVLASGKVFTHLYDLIRPFQQVTKAIS